jgi:hypothetical protein
VGSCYLVHTDDTWVKTPDVNNSIKWDHAGHAITIGELSMAAYWFGKIKPASVANPFRKSERDSKAYCRSLERCVTDISNAFMLRPKAI